MISSSPSSPFIRPNLYPPSHSFSFSFSPSLLSFFLTPHQLTPQVHAGQVGTIRTVHGESGLVRHSRVDFFVHHHGASVAKRGGREEDALSQLGVSGIRCSSVAEARHDGTDQWGAFSSALTLSNSTCCILTAVLSPYHVSSFNLRLVNVIKYSIKNTRRCHPRDYIRIYSGEYPRIPFPSETSAAEVTGPRNVTSSRV